jgi:hypothetical protein
VGRCTDKTRDVSACPCTPLHPVSLTFYVHGARRYLLPAASSHHKLLRSNFHFGLVTVYLNLRSFFAVPSCSAPSSFRNDACLSAWIHSFCNFRRHGVRKDLVRAFCWAQNTEWQWKISTETQRTAVALLMV